MRILKPTSISNSGTTPTSIDAYLHIHDADASAANNLLICSSDDSNYYFKVASNGRVHFRGNSLIGDGQIKVHLQHSSKEGAASSLIWDNSSGQNQMSIRQSEEDSDLFIYAHAQSLNLAEFARTTADVTFNAKTTINGQGGDIVQAYDNASPTKKQVLNIDQNGVLDLTNTSSSANNDATMDHSTIQITNTTAITGGESVLIGKDVAGGTISFATSESARYTAIGYGALMDATAPSGFMTAIGSEAGQETNGSISTFVGHAAGGYFNVSNGAGDRNTAMGVGAMASGWSASGTYIGDEAGYFSYGNGNVFLGRRAGKNAGATASTNDFNIMIGYQAGEDITDGTDYNLFIGTDTAYNATIGGGNTILGHYLQRNSTENLSDTVIVGSYDNERFRITSDNKFGVGTTTPSEAFEVYGDEDRFLVHKLNQTTVYQTWYEVNADDDKILRMGLGDSDQDFAFILTDKDRLLWYLDGAPKMELRKSGDLEIGRDGQKILISTFAGANADGDNIWIGGGGLSSVGDASDGRVGSSNIAIGVDAMLNTTTGKDNVAIGLRSLGTSTEGSQNVAVGYESLYDLTTGSWNTATGYKANGNNTTGSYNTSLGYAAGFGSTTADANTSVGYAALFAMTTGEQNTAIGKGAGWGTSTEGNNLDCNNSVFVGHNAVPNLTEQTNQIVIGHNTTGNGSNTVTLGNDNITGTYLQGTINLNDYQTADADGTAVRTLGVDASGNVVKFDGAINASASIFSATTTPIHTHTGHTGTGNYSMIVDYTVNAQGGGAMRTGRITGITDGTSISFTDSVTASIGDTSDFELSFDLETVSTQKFLRLNAVTTVATGFHSKYIINQF
jgi:hypothetical protein